MNKVLSLSTLLFSLGLNAQIELNKENFATVNAKERMSDAATSSEIDLNTGAGYFWDFSQLVATGQQIEEYNPISGLGMLANFQFGPAAPSQYKATYCNLNQDVPLQNLPSILPITFSDYNNIFRLSDDSLSLVGISVSVNGQTMPIRYSDIEAQYRFPVQYGDHYTTYGKFDQDMNPIYDAKWRQKRQHEINVDGWGKVFTPIGNFDCLRIKHRVTEQDSMYITVSGFGVWIPINVPTQTIYEWRTTSEGSPLIRVKTNITGNGNNQTETISSIQFRDNNVFVGTKELAGNSLFNVYPNPVNNVLNIDANGTFEQYEILSLDGKSVQKGMFFPAIDCSALESGAYILRLTSKTNVENKTFVKQ
ncbi:MAG TPA: T9SS type A sorting domain-containing protein [Crocinitomicaceae bacterium]|nr:T9SS type A sorting domain-containing protein [Crocinitomicaceae bacterium]